MNVVQWFADNIFGDLQAGAGGVHPVLQVDAIRYLYTFRYQVCLEASVDRDQYAAVCTLIHVLNSLQKNN